MGLVSSRRADEGFGLPATGKAHHLAAAFRPLRPPCRRRRRRCICIYTISLCPSALPSFHPSIPPQGPVAPPVALVATPSHPRVPTQLSPSRVRTAGGPGVAGSEKRWRASLAEIDRGVFVSAWTASRIKWITMTLLTLLRTLLSAPSRYKPSTKGICKPDATKQKHKSIK